MQIIGMLNYGMNYNKFNINRAAIFQGQMYIIFGDDLRKRHR